MYPTEPLVRLLTVIIITTCIAAPTAGQDQSAEEETMVPPGQWNSTIEGRIAGNQSGYHNWQEGGSSAISFMAELRGTADRENDEWSQSQSFRLAFGQKKQGGLSFRKDQDIVSYDFSLQYQGDGNLDPTVSGGMRTQFAPSFNYNSNPFEDGREPPVKVSDALSPAYVKQSLGLTYDPNEWSSFTFGVAGKETIVLINRLRPLYMEGVNQSVRVQVGVDATTDVEKEIVENVMLRSKLSLFAAFNKSDLPDMRWENRITMKVNEWIQVDIEAVAYYDRDVSSELQFRENLSIGASYTFL